MSKKNGNLIEVLSGVIRGVLNGDIDPQQANAINGTVSQIIKIAKMQIQHRETLLEGVSIPKTTLITSEISTTEHIRNLAFAHISANGEGTFKDIGDAIGIQWEKVAQATCHDLFITTGNVVSLRN